MKRIISVLMISLLALGSLTVAFADSEFVITNDGEITAYYGGEWVVVPDMVDGIPVVKLGEMTFFDLGILDAYLPEGLSVIGRSAFEGSNITSVDIPSTISIIGERAFANCSELETVFINFDENTKIGKDAFIGTGYIIFYINCDIDTKTIERELLMAKGDGNFDVVVRHTGYDYDALGNGICYSCGFHEIVAEMPFEDVAFDAWYHDYVYTAYVNQIINGKSETIFAPDAGMTCAEAAKIAACINALFAEPVPEYTYGPWYQPYVDYCYEYGLIEEYITFEWDKPITRAQMAYIFSHCDPFDDWYENINDVPITDIPDVYDTTPFAYEILELYNKGIVIGDVDMAFFPDSNIKRCEVAAIVARIIDWQIRIELAKG